MTIKERLEAAINSFNEGQQELQQLANKSQEINSRLLVLKGTIETLNDLLSEETTVEEE